MPENTLFYGDNLKVLREHIPDASVDLIYLDPPFNSNRAYNVLFKEKSGEASPAQIEAFDDTWTWDQAAEATFAEIIETAPEHVGEMIDAMQRFIGRNDMMAYLVMMAIRLVELHRVLKPTGSIYLHCDPTASHYLKIVLDTVFGKDRFRNEIVWKRTGAHSSAIKFAPVHDVILYYSRSDKRTWNKAFQPHRPGYVDDKYRHVDADGRRYQLDNLTAAGTRNGSSGKPWRGIDPTARGYHWKFTVERLDELDKEGRIYWPVRGSVPRYKRYLDEVSGIAMPDVWDDIDPLNSQGSERLGYPTQKPQALLERIIAASSNPGDVVLDPFCGCGTAVIAAEKLGRKWIGIDVTHLAIALMKSRLMDSFGLTHINVVGLPPDAGGARALFEQDPYQFQFWAAGLVNAMPRGGKEKKGADRGIDGVIPFIDGANRGRKECIVQVKGGKVSSGQIRDLRGTMEREKAEMALFITLNPPTSEMRTEAASAGFYRSELWGRDFPRIQIATVEDLLAGRMPQLPVGIIGSQQAPRLQHHTAPRQTAFEVTEDFGN